MFRRAGIVSIVSLTCFLFCGFTQPVACKNQNSGPSVVGPAIAVGAVVTAAVVIPIVVVHEKHTVKGCTYAGPNGLELQERGGGDENGGRKSYVLEGAIQDIKPGYLVKLHGAKIKHHKQDPGNQQFTVEKLSKEYGPCTVAPVPVSGATASNKT